MQTLKEKLAWGGTLPHPTWSPDQEWSVDDDVVDFLLEGYLRGWGLTGARVDLEVGTALFPRVKDVARWNDACIRQIEQR